MLILDEPTAVLTPQESEALFATLRADGGAGLAIIFISHKLDEVLRVSQRIAVLRAGRLVAVLPAAGADKPMLAEAMVGRSVRCRAATPPPPRAGTPACELRGATVRAAGRQGRPLLDGVTLRVQPGEIVAIAGVSGNGQAVLAELLCGAARAGAGSLQVAGRALPPRPRAFVDAGVARIPEDRHAVGVVGDLALWENAVLERYHRAGVRALRRHAARRRDAPTRRRWSSASTCAAPRRRRAHADARAVGRQHAEADPRPRPAGAARLAPAARARRR